jgi:tRNA(Arg) A34 adenosine deaminase TadA
MKKDVSLEDMSARYSPDDTARILDVIACEIYPIVHATVCAGNNPFGAAVLGRSDLKTLVTGANRKVENPIYHAEITAIRRFFSLDSHPEPGETIFVSTHEPCPMCLSALAWAGFPNIVHLFSVEETRDDFMMPDDICILEELFLLEEPRRKTRYYEMISLRDLALYNSDTPLLQQRMAEVKRAFLSLMPTVLSHRSTSQNRDV